MNMMPALECSILPSAKLRAKTREGWLKFRHRKLCSRIRQQVTFSTVLLKSKGEQTLIDRSQNYLGLIRQQTHEIHRLLSVTRHILMIKMDLFQHLICHFWTMTTVAQAICYVCLSVTPAVSGVCGANRQQKTKFGRTYFSSLQHFFSTKISIVRFFLEIHPKWKEKGK